MVQQHGLKTVILTVGESVPVVSGYYADKSEAGRKTVTPGNPNAEDVVTYKPLGKIIQVDEDGNVIPNSTSVTYNNNPSNPKKPVETKIPDAPTGYVIGGTTTSMGLQYC
ncbi:MAG: hypothetical protein ACLVJN_08035 [Streptococcus parasanguinis]